MADLEMSQFTNLTSPAATDYLAGYLGSAAGNAGGNRRCSFANIATFVLAQTAVNVDITGGTIDGTVIGGITPVNIRGYMPSATTFNGTSGTLALTDAEYFQICSNAATQTLTIPTNASVAFPINTEIVFFQQGAGQVVFSAAGGVTLQSASSATKIATQYGCATLKKIGTDTWVLFGNISS